MLFSDVLTTYSADSCTWTPFCVYVHDGSLQKGKDGTPLEDVPSSCFSSTNQLCAMCSFIVTVRMLPLPAAFCGPSPHASKGLVTTAFSATGLMYAALAGLAHQWFQPWTRAPTHRCQPTSTRSAA
eukprot:jgi/Ulvmu1/1762/UM118_0001.1